MKNMNLKVLEIASEAVGALLIGQAVVFGIAAITCGVGSFALVGTWREVRTKHYLNAGCRCGSPVVNAARWGVRCVKTARVPDRCGDKSQHLNRRFAKDIVADVRRIGRASQSAGPSFP